jgi:hypothetical protein
MNNSFPSGSRPPRQHLNPCGNVRRRHDWRRHTELEWRGCVDTGTTGMTTYGMYDTELRSAYRRKGLEDWVDDLG